MALKPGNYSSWTVESQTVVKKHCDLTAHVWGLTTIDKRIASFWGTEHLAPNREMLVILHHQGDRAQTKIAATERGQCRLYFTSKLRDYLKRHDFWKNDITLLFEKAANGEFNVKAERKQTIRVDGRDPLVTVANVGCKGEGTRKGIYTTIYERIPKYRNQAIQVHGCVCKACGFDFAKIYGEHGKNFIEVHHTKPLYTLMQRVVPDPKNDMVCVCSNCHRMIHHKRGKILTVEDLQKMIKKQKENMRVLMGCSY